MSFNGSDDELPKVDMDALFMKIWMWNGLPPAPQITHWMSEGRIAIVASIPRKTSSVQWNGQHIGYDDINPNWPLYNLLEGKYDESFGFKISEMVPAKLSDWNNL